MLLDGLLEREFGGAVSRSNDRELPLLLANRSATPASQRRRRIDEWRAALTPRAVLLIVLTAVLSGGWSLWRAGPSDSAPHSVLLVDAGFEDDGGSSAVTTGIPLWQGDQADIVGHFSGIAPLEGSRMLRFVRSSAGTENACELYQIVDLSTLVNLLKDGDAVVEASAFFNAIPELRRDGCIFSVTVIACSNDPAELMENWPERASTFSSQLMAADDDTTSWQQVAARLPIPTGARYLVVQIAVIRRDVASPESNFPGQFVDGVELNLVKS
jgi:hypothetical protein